MAVVFCIPFLFKRNGEVYPIYFKITKYSGRGVSYKKVYIVFFSILTAMLIGLRSSNVGIDTAGYINTRYARGSILLFDDDWEVVTDITAIIAQLFSNDPQLFLLLNGILVATLFGKFIYDNTDQVNIAFLVFLGMFFVQSMNLMREWLAIGFALNAYTYYSKRKPKKAVVMLLLAVFTHLTAICLLFIPIFDRFKNKKRALLITIGAGLAFVGLQRTILSIITSIFPKYLSYLTKTYFLGENAFNIKNLIFIAILSYIIITAKNTKDIKEKDQYWTYAAYISLAITFSLCGGTYQMMHRLAYYYSAFLIIIIPQVIRKLRFSVIIKLLIVIAMFIMLARNGSSDNNGISQYYFFWQQNVY